MQAQLAIYICCLDRAEAQRIHLHVALRYNGRCRINERVELHVLQRGCQVVGLKNNRSRPVGWVDKIRSKQLATGNLYSGNYSKREDRSPFSRRCGRRILKVPQPVRIRDHVDYWIVQHHGLDYNPPVQQRHSIDRRVYSCRLKKVAGREWFGISTGKVVEADGQRNPSYPDMTDLDLLPGFCLQIGDNLAPVAIWVG